MGFVKTVSITRLRRRFLPVVGTSPSIILLSALGSGSAGLGSGEIMSTSARGSGSETALDLAIKEEKEHRDEHLAVASSVARNCLTEDSYLAVRLPAFLGLETLAAFSRST